MYFTESAPASYGPCCGSAPCYSRPEDVRILAIVIPELKFGNVQWQVFGGNLVVGAHDAAFDEAPEAFNRIRMDGADNVFAPTVADNRVVVALHPGISAVFIGSEQVNLGGDNLTHKPLERRGVGMAQDTSDDAPRPFNGASYDKLTGGAPNAGALVRMLILGLPADVSFVNLNDAHELAELWVNQTGANAHAEVMGGTVGAKTHDALHFESGNTLLAGEQHMDDAEPVAEADIGVFKDGPDQHREAVASVRAIPALPMEGAGNQGGKLLVIAAGALNPHRPAARLQISLASVVIGESGFEFPYCHLLGELSLGHNGGSFV